MVKQPIIGIVNQIYEENGAYYADLDVCWSTNFNRGKAKPIKGFPITLEFYKDYFNEVEESQQDGAEKEVMFQGELEVCLEDKPPWDS